MENVETNIVPAETGYEMDAELKQILAHRYEDISEKFTPEAQQTRRNNRLRFTVYLTGFCVLLCNFCLWACEKGLMDEVLMMIGICSCMLVIGYNIGICVSHNKGWRGA